MIIQSWYTHGRWMSHDDVWARNIGQRCRRRCYLQPTCTLPVAPDLRVPPEALSLERNRLAERHAIRTACLTGLRKGSNPIQELRSFRPPLDDLQEFLP